MCGYLQQLREWRNRSRGDHVEGALDALRLRTADRRCQFERFADLVEKFDPETARLRQRDRPVDQARDHDSGKTRARTDVDPRSSCGGLVANQLRAIEDVPVPDMLERRRGHEVLATIFLSEQRDIRLQ